MKNFLKIILLIISIVLGVFIGDYLIEKTKKTEDDILPKTIKKPISTRKYIRIK